MEVVFKGNWNNKIESDLISWSRTVLSELKAEIQDEELLNFISVLVCNKKVIGDIHNEVKEFIDESKSKYNFTLILLHLY